MSADGAYEYSGGWADSQRHGYGVMYQVWGVDKKKSYVAIRVQRRLNSLLRWCCVACATKQNQMGQWRGRLPEGEGKRQRQPPTHPLPPAAPAAAWRVQVHGGVAGRRAGGGGQVPLCRWLRLRWPVEGWKEVRVGVPMCVCRWAACRVEAWVVVGMLIVGAVRRCMHICGC